MALDEMSCVNPFCPDILCDDTIMSHDDVMMAYAMSSMID